jgi:hypothetical protein
MATTSPDAVRRLLPAGTVSLTSPYRFYVGMAAVIVAIAIAGFIPSYWAPVARGSFAGAPILHVHGVLFTAWTLLFLAQARLAAIGGFEGHRALGLAGIAVATAMVFVGVGVSIHSMEMAIARGAGEQGRSFSIVPVTIVLSFAALFAGAIANIRRPDVHMRLMLLASISILPPAVARLLRVVVAGIRPTGVGDTPPLAFTIVPNLLADVLIAVAIVHDWRTRGRPHPVYLVAGGALVAVQILRVPLSGTATWHAIAGWLMRFSG